MEFKIMAAYTAGSLVIATVVCMMARKWGEWVILAGFAGSLAACVVTAAKVATLFPGVFVSVAIGLYSATFLYTDVLSEIYGKKAGYRAVLAGLVIEVIMLMAALFSVKAVAAPFYENADGFAATFGSTPRIIVASILAYCLAQVHDVWAFHLWKKKTKGRHLWLRNIASTIVSQTIDTVVFYTVAFAGVVPGLFQLIWVTCLVKYAIALLDTPFCYAVVAYLRRRKGPAAGPVEPQVNSANGESISA